MSLAGKLMSAIPQQMKANDLKTKRLLFAQSGPSTAHVCFVPEADITATMVLPQAHCISDIFTDRNCGHDWLSILLFYKL